MTWQEYEQFVLNYFRSRFNDSNIQHNVFKKGFDSLTDRQVDILVEQIFSGYKFEIAIECKNWQRPLDVGDVEQFVAKLRDIRVTKGAMVSKAGYTKAAKQLANSLGNIHLHVLSTEELGMFTGFWGNPYNGNSGAILYPPNGWILDSKVPSEIVGSTLCVMHPIEITTDESLQNKECILFQIPFVTKDEQTNEQMQERIDKIMKEQEENTLKFDKDSTFKYWEINTKKGKTQLRLIEYSDYNEIANFLYTPYCITFIFGICRKEYTNQFIEHIQFMISELILITLKNVDLENSHEAWTRFLHNHVHSEGTIQKVVFR